MAKNKGQKSQRGGSKRSYARISLKRRKMLIQMIFKEGFSIARAIKKLSLKLTTKFKESGTFPMKQFKKNARMLRDLPNDDPTSPHIHVKVEASPEAEAVKIEALEEEELADAKQQSGNEEMAYQQSQQAAFFWYCYQPYLYS